MSGKRDWYDTCSIVIQGLGVIALVATIVITQWNVNSSSRDMANALGSMATIAGTLEKQQSAIINQSEAMTRLASETQTVASATQQQAGSSIRMSEYNRQQAEAASKQLALTQSAKVDLDMHLTLYRHGAPFEAQAVIHNSGAQTVHASLTLARVALHAGEHLDQVWQNELKPGTIDLVPGVPHNAPVRMRYEDTIWEDLDQGKASLVFGARLKFKDASGNFQQLQQCLAVTGPPDDPRLQNC